MEFSSDANVSLQSILIKIGFIQYEGRLLFNFGNCKLSAVQGINRYFQEGYNFFGFYIDERSSKEFDFFLPLHVESYEQGLALFAYYLRKANFQFKPKWLNEGYMLGEHLPWNKEMRAYRENPRAIIDHEWFRVLVNKLRTLISESTDEDVTTFYFDGTVLKVVCNMNETVFVVCGNGKQWHQTAIVKTKSLEFLPKRILKRNVSIFIWQNDLHVGNRIFRLIV